MRLFNPKKISLIFACSLGPLLIASCGGTGQDVGAASLDTEQSINGIAIDGYVARALVFIDYDNNGTRDPWEPHAFTDNDGYYSFNPITQTNYCAPDTEPADALFCLTTDRVLNNEVIRIDGGYDILTGEPFVGQMSRRVSVEQGAVSSIVISPLTTLFTHINSDIDRQILLSNLGIDESALDEDYLNSDGNGGINTELMNLAVKVHKVVSVLADKIEDTYTEIGEESGTPNDLSAFAYKELTRVLSNRAINIHTALKDPDVLNEILSKTEVAARSYYDRRDLLLPAMTGDFARVNANVQALADVVDQLIPASNNGIDQAAIRGRSRALEALVIKNLDENNQQDSTINTAAEFFTNPANATLVNTLINSLTENTADVKNLASSSFTFQNEEDVTRESSVPDNATPFSNMAGYQLRVSDSDLGYGPDELKDIEVEIYFQGLTGAIKGDFAACVKYIEGASVDGSLGEGNSRGELVSGHWSLLGADLNSGESYSLLLTINFLGTKYQAIMKPGETTQQEGGSEQEIRFDYAGEIRSWYSQGLTESVLATPTSHRQCEERLPSRIGL